MGSSRHRFLMLVVLLIAAVGVRAWRAWQGPVVNPDAIRFVDQAEAIYRGDVKRALLEEPYHPLHAAVGGAVHRVVEPMWPGAKDGDSRGQVIASRMSWLWSMQAVGVACGAIVAVQIVLLSRRLGAPFWAAMAAGVLWIVGRRTSAYGADGLSDMLCLSLFAGAMLVAMPALPPRRLSAGRAAMRFLVAGLLAGLAYLTRPEGLAAPLILGLTLVLMYLPRVARPWRPKSPALAKYLRPTEGASKVRPRRTWPAMVTVGALAALAVGTVLVASPYMAAIGGITNKKAIFDAAPGQLPAAVAPAGGITMLTNPAAWRKIVMELWETFGFAPFLVNLLAAGICPHLWGRPRYRLLVIVWVALWVFVMLWLYERSSYVPAERYLDGRHTLPLLLVAHCWFAIALGLWRTPMRWWQNWWRRRPSWNALPAWMRWRRWPMAFAVIVAVLAMLPGVVRLGVPPLKDKGYLLEASRWLAATYGDQGTLVLGRDPRPAYYAGLRYRMWSGTPEQANFPLSARDREGTVLATYIFQTRRQPVAPTMGEFVLRKTFVSVGTTQDDVLAVYERAGTGRQ